MTAKEMFEELVFNLGFENEKWLSYEKMELYDTCVAPTCIVFSKKDKGYYAFACMPDGSKKFLGIQVDEHKAINKQLEELGVVECLN